MTSGAGDSAGRRPWWYSGDAEGEQGQVPADLPPSDSVSDDASDAWSDGNGEEQAEDASSSTGMDWSILMAGAQRMVDWATEKVMAPHAEHDDPAEHPQCMVCRTILLVGDPSGLGPPSSDPMGATASDATHGEESAPEPVRWIPIRD